MEQLVSYEVAKLMKEKEISIKCSHFFVLPYSNIKPNFIAQKFNKDLSENQFQFVTISKSQPHLAGAPTQSALAELLREEYGIHVFPSMYSNSNDYEFKIYIKGKNLITTGAGLSFKEAFEEGLLQALKLIKI
jgi:hypothetical protein